MRSIAFMLSLTLIFLIPWENAVLVGEFGTLTRAIGILTAAVWLISVTKAGVRKLHPFHMAVLPFILWNMVSFFWSVDVDETLQNIKTYIQLAIMAWIIWDLYTTSSALKAGLQAYILGAYVAICSTILNYISGQPISSYSGGRFAGAGLNAGDLALILALGLPVAWHLASSPGHNIKARVLRIVNYAYIPVSLYAIMLTGSRMALFALLPGALYIIVTATRLKPIFRIIIFAFFMGALFAVNPYIPQKNVDRIMTSGESIRSLDIGGRGRLWSMSISTFSKYPFLGVGSGALRTLDEIGGTAHNTFLSVLAELGLIGFTLFFSMLAIVLYHIVKQPKWLSMFWLTIFAIWAIGVSVQTWEVTKPTWLFLSLAVASASLSDGYATTVIHSFKSPKWLAR